MRKFIGFFVLIHALFAAGAGAVVYVDKSAPGGDGSSWADAFNTLQPAIEAASVGGDEVWVAMGDYNEVRYVPTDPPTEQDNGSLVIRPGVAIYGGFAGDESERNQRDWETNVTIINGSTARSGGPACHVVIMADGILDGFTVTGGSVSPFVPCINAGAGIFISGGAPVVRNCVINSNSASGAGGAMTANGSAGTFENCLFTNNYSNRGGAIEMSSCTTTFSKCRFQSNTCAGYRTYSAFGGAITMYSSSPQFVNCVFWENRAVSAFSTPSYGGAVDVTSASYPEFLNCTFYGNVATNDSPKYSSNYGGAIRSDESSLPSVTNSILWGNIPDQVYGPALVLYTDIQGGRDAAGCIDADPLFTDALGRLAGDSPCIGAGWLDAAPVDDTRGVARPQGSGVDMGAYEMVYATASFSANVTTGLAPFDVQFTDLTSNPGVTDWLWDFGDGATSTEQHPAHAYTTPGSFTVSLTITTSDCTDTKTIAGYITAYGELMPAFSMDTNFGRRPLEVQFADLSVSPGPITGWLWRFGDGSTSTQRNPVHIYRVPGLFTVSLMVTAGPESAKCAHHDAILVVNKSGAAPKPWLIRWLESQLE